jgi:alkyldihydroxyacetonephosphate synthase
MASQRPNHAVIGDLTAKLGSTRVLVDIETRKSHRRDAWVLSDLDELESSGQTAEADLPACVVRPASTADVVTVVNLCRSSGTALVTAGLRSGVCGGLLAGAGQLVLDMSSMNSVRSINRHDLIGSFEAGLRGSDAEAKLNADGLTLGHFPQSMALSSVGGWVATRAAGQFSTGYGNIEDMLLGLEAVLPDGSVMVCGDAPRASAGPDLKQLLLGSEGTLGVITRVDLALRRVAETRVGMAYYTPDMRAGFEVQREILQAGHCPVVMRLYDAREVGRLFGKFRNGDQCLLLVVHEGPKERVHAEQAAVTALVEARGGAVAPSGATEHWLSERNRVPTFKSFLENGVIVDTIEVAASYTKIGQLYDSAIAALGKLEGIWNGSAHSSHAYRTGINLYFSFAIQPKDRSKLRDAYRACWQAVMQASIDAGGTISHHHGIGRVRRQWLAEELGDTGLGLLAALKRTLDPTGFMNPGVLLP